MWHRLRAPALVLTGVLAVAGCADASELAAGAGRPAPTGPSTPASPGAPDQPSAPASPPDEQDAPPESGPPPRPEVGQCRPTPQQVLDRPVDPTEPVECGQPHTLETFAVIELDSTEDGGDDEGRALEECRRRLGDYLGRPDTAATRISWFYFVTETEDGGWLRCDIGLSTTTGTGPVEPVTGSLKDVLADGVPPAQRSCLATLPDPRQAQPLVPCTEPHQAELVPRSKRLGSPGSAYPGARKLLEANLDWCRRLTAKVDGADISRIEVPTPAAWRAGVVRATCWAVAPEGSALPPLGTTI